MLVRHVGRLCGYHQRISRHVTSVLTPVREPRWLAACAWLESNQLATSARGHHMQEWLGPVLAPGDAAYRTCSTNELQARVSYPMSWERMASRRLTIRIRSFPMVPRFG